MTIPPPPYGPPGYPPPPPPPGDWQAPRPTSGKAIASLICAGAGLFVCFVVSIVGLILGVIGLTETGKNGTRSGRGLAIAGTILSALTLAINLAAVIAFFSLGALAEQEQEEQWASRLDSDVKLIVERVQRYYQRNDNSLGPGGPVLSPSSAHQPPSESSGPASDGKVVGVLTIQHLVSSSELKWGIDHWELTVTDRAKATLRARGWNGEVIREINVTDAGSGAYIESAGSTIR